MTRMVAETIRSIRHTGAISVFVPSAGDLASVSRRVELCEDSIHALLHGSRLVRLIVDVPEKVQNAVDEQVKQHLSFGVTQVRSVIRSPIRTDDHISQEIGVLPQTFSFQLREREHVGRSLLPAVPAVQFRHLRGVHQHHRESRGRVTTQAF